MIDLIAVLMVSFFSTYFITPKVIRYFKEVGIVTTDVHKKGMPLVPHSIGVPVAVGVVAGLLFYVFIKTFIQNAPADVEIFAAIATIMIIMLGGFLDDLNTRQKRVSGHLEGKRGLRAFQKFLLTVPAAVPLMVIMAGDATMNIPFFGSINFGVLYPLVIVPIGIVGSANMVNMLGGFNGLEAGMGAVYTFSLGLFALNIGEYVAAVILLSTFAALVAILKFNWYPAKIIAGDTITYTLGAIVAVSAIIGNMEKAALIIMAPFLIQGFLKFYARLKLGRFPSDMGVLQKDGTVKSKYDKDIYSWTHLIMNSGNLTEKQVVMRMMLIQAFFSILPFLKII